MFVARQNPTNRGGMSVPLGNLFVYRSGTIGVTELAMIALEYLLTNLGWPLAINWQETTPANQRLPVLRLP
jgi:hypothetical protein